MDSHAIDKTLKGNSRLPPMPNVRETPLHYISSTVPNHSTSKDVSLSSSLKPKDHSPKSKENGIGVTSDVTEISIFEAQKYFSESNDPKGVKGDPSSHDLVSVPRTSSVSSVVGYGRNFRTKSFRSTPTASSEVSCNSQTGLLANPPRWIRVSLKNLSLDCINKRWYTAKKWLFGRKCCCNGEKSVQVKETTADWEQKRRVVLINTEKTNTKFIERDQSYKVQRTSGNCSITDNIVEIHHIKAMVPSPLTLSSTDFSSIDAPRQQRILASGRSFIDGAVSFTFPILEPLLELPSVSGPYPREDDAVSDASSDLFEIESLSTQTTSCPILYRRRNSVDQDHSEVGIDGSTVTTAEGESTTNLSISALENGGVTALRPRGEEAVGGEGKMKSNGLILMGCRQEKAASMGPESMKCVAEGPPMLPSHVGGRSPKPPLGSSHSARLSLAFAA